jgi:hypothetical protein
MSEDATANDTETKVYPERQIGTSGVVWQALSAVIDGKDDVEAKERLGALTIDELRDFHFQLDRIRTLTYNVRYRKMKEADERARAEHLASVRKAELEATE